MTCIVREKSSSWPIRIFDLIWFLCMRTGSRHRPWNSLVIYLDEIIGVSTRRLELNFTSCYRCSSYYIHLTCRNFIYQHSAVTETTVKQHPLAFILFDFQNWESPHHCYFSAVNTSYRRHQLPGSCTRDTFSLFHILTCFVHGGGPHRQGPHFSIG